MRISIGCDHIVTKIKDEIVVYLKEQGHEVIDEGTYSNERTHYPIFGRKVGIQLLNNTVDFGIVICGTGVGITNAANKVPGVRCALVQDITTAQEARKTLNANVLGLGGRIVGLGLMQNIIDVFLQTSYNPTPENEALIQKINALKQDNTDIRNENIFDDLLEKWDNGFYHD